MKEKELIKAVRAQTALYDTNHPDYMKAKLKGQLWDDVAREVSLVNGDEAKTVWVKLRHCYRDAIRRQKKGLKNGTPAKSLKQWKFQKQMDFLQPYMVKKPHKVNSLHDDVDIENPPQKSEIIESENTQESRDDVQSENEHNITGPSNIEEPKISTKSSNSKPKAKKMKKCDINEQLKQTLVIHQKKTTNDQGKGPNDSLYYFFISMYEITKNMPLQCQHVVRNNVYQSVADVEAKLLNISSSQQSSFFDRHLSQYSYNEVNSSSQSSYSISSSPQHIVP